MADLLSELLGSTQFCKVLRPGVSTLKPKAFVAGSYVRYWPKADIPSCTAHVRFQG